MLEAAYEAAYAASRPYGFRPFAPEAAAPPARERERVRERESE